MEEKGENYQFVLGPGHAKAYCSNRPTYPSFLIEIIKKYMQENRGTQFEQAVDVGCGNGQATKHLSEHFKQVLGTDISDLQIAETKSLEFPKNVNFSVAPAEKIPFSDNSVDLVLAAQAAHFFNMEKFYKEADRVLKSGGCLCLIAFGPLRIRHPDHDKELDEATASFKAAGKVKSIGIAMFENLYADVVLPYPDQTREDVEFIDSNMTVSSFTGYISGWRSYQKSFQENPDIATHLQSLQDRIMEILNAKTPPQETPVCTVAPAFVIIGRKP